MNDTHHPQGVSQKIFQMGLSVETVSVYLLCAGLAEAGTTLSLKNLSELWNGTTEQLTEGLKHLEGRNAIRKIISDAEENVVYAMVSPDKWKCH